MGIGGIEHAGAAQQPPPTHAGLGQAAAALGMCFAGECVADAAAPAGACHGTVVVGEGAFAELLAQLADAERPVRQALGQQLLGAVEAEIQGLHAAEGIGNHHLRAAGTADARLRRQLERPDRYLAAVLAQAIDIQLDRRWHHRLAEEGRGGGEDAIRLQPVIAPDLQAAQAYRPAPVDKPAVEVANLQGQRLVREIQCPARIKAYAFAAPVAVSGLVATADGGVLEGAGTDAEHSQFRAQGKVAEAVDTAAVQVVIEQDAGRGAAAGSADLRAAEHGRGQGQLVQWHVQREGLQVRVIAHHRTADLVEVHRGIAAGVEAKLAQDFGAGLQAATVVGEGQQAARRAVEGHVQVQRLVGREWGWWRQQGIGGDPGDIGCMSRRGQGRTERCAHQRLSEPVVAAATSVPTRH